MNNFNQPIDLYCERLAPGFWAEPLNAISNTAFILAGLFALGLLRRQNLKSWQLTTLGILTIIVGIGSFTFHTIATRGAILADDIPIISFIVFALYVIFIEVFGAKPIISALCIVAFAAINAAVLSTFPIKTFNGSIMYVPSLIILIIIAIYSTAKKQSCANYFIISAGSFLLSITFRSLDQKLCGVFPLGTHFMWHILNAVTMYYAMRGLIKLKNL